MAELATIYNQTMSFLKKKLKRQYIIVDDWSPTKVFISIWRQLNYRHINYQGNQIIAHKNKSAYIMKEQNPLPCFDSVLLQNCPHEIKTRQSTPKANDLKNISRC